MRGKRFREAKGFISARSRGRALEGFTLMELLMVMAIIGILTTLGFVVFTGAQKKARDGRRLADLDDIQTALALYYSDNASYPGNTDNDCSGWDAGWNGGPSANDAFISPLVAGAYVTKVPGDPRATDHCGGYAYYRYNAGSYGCDSSKGAFYVLGVRDMETSGRPHPKSPGWSCPGRNWQNGFDWVTGGFEQ